MRRGELDFACAALLALSACSGSGSAGGTASTPADAGMAPTGSHPMPMQDAATPKGTSADCSDPVCTADYPCQMLVIGYTCRGQFADWTPSDSPSSFKDNGDGTVIDMRNGLAWQQRVGPESDSLDAARTQCAGLELAGGGWRVPTNAELQSIQDFGRSEPAIDPVAFPDTPHADFFSVSSNGSHGYVTDFRFGGTQLRDPADSSAAYVRCVRGNETVVASDGPGGAPPSRYETPGDGTIYDTRTKLTWQQVLDPNSYMLADAMSYCTGLSLAGGGWRLPKISELLTLIDLTQPHAPYIDPTAFSGTSFGAWFWSSTKSAAWRGNTWNVYIAQGTPDVGSDGLLQVRCVR